MCLVSTAAAAPPPPPPPPPPSSKKKKKKKKKEKKWTPSRVTRCRMRSREKKDAEVLKAHKGKPQCQPGDPCPICGGPRTLDTGHALYKGTTYCEVEDGPGAPTAREWLDTQQAPEDVGKIPRTTAWNLQQRFRAAESQVAGSSSAPTRKTHKLRICQRCLQPAQKDFGHSRFKGTNFCALYAGKSVELWLAEERSRKRGRKK